MTTALKTDLPNLAIVGAGRVGASLHAAAAATGVPVKLLDRDREPGLVATADVVLIATPDEQIGATATEIAAELKPSAIVGHTSGATPIAALGTAIEACSGAFVIHPLQTIPTGETDLASVACAVSGSTPEAAARAWALATALGMNPFEVGEEDRAAYHAAATIASNFLFALEESASELLATAGVRSPREALAPLVLSSARNWAEHGPAALTGPIARGDERTTKRHLAAIAERAPGLLPLYETLAERTREIARLTEPVG
jgi:predicted short-subunit dehydrogenase-like oxidoreductase (DUF2520 family)